MLTIHDVHLSYGQQPVLNGVSFTLGSGEIIGFLGDNGSGKTTTLSILSGVLRPQQGSIEWNGEPIWSNKSTYLTNVGYVPDYVPLYPNATVRENLEYTAKLKHIHRSRVQSVLQELRLLEIAHHRVSTLSKGWRQWAGIAQGWIHKPQLLLLDEPTAGLDPSGRRYFEQWIQSIRDDGHTVFFSSHIVREIDAVSNRVLELQQGSIVTSNCAQWNIHCVVRIVPADINNTLLQIDGVENVALSKQTILITCTRDCRAEIASCLVMFDLLEMRRS